MTTIYLIRHSEGFRPLQGEMNTKDSVQIIHEKSPLSVYGEKLAENIASNKEFKNLDIVFSSHYVRAMSTAKYFASNNNLKVNIDDRLGERIQGIKSWDELPSEFEQRQLLDPTYKIGFGENQLEVRKRMEEILNEILNNYKDKRIAIISHGTAMSFLLMNWCNIEYQKPWLFNNKVFFEGKINFCEIFKLVFENNKLLSIENIKC